MKRTFTAFSLILLCGLIVVACGSEVKRQASQPVPPPSADLRPTVAPSQPAVAPDTGPEATTAPTHAMVPGDMPRGKGIFLGDQSAASSYSKARALVGDRFTFGKFERPYNANSMDTYYPFVDIVSANFYPRQVWVFARITLVGPDPNNGFPAKYAVEIDKNLDGRGETLIMADHPASRDWTTDGVRVFVDRDGDVGGLNVIVSDSVGSTGDGYESVVFDQGKGPDPNAAWARLASGDPNSVELAFKTSLLEGHSAYLAGIWAGTDSLNPALFDLNDHFTHEQVGEANPDFANFYPIKALYELDNTCRVAIGFTPSGREPAVCPQGQ
jgi:hypothetical protein